jgi:hypothetical protein
VDGRVTTQPRSRTAHYRDLPMPETERKAWASAVLNEFCATRVSSRQQQNSSSRSSTSSSSDIMTYQCRWQRGKPERRLCQTGSAPHRYTDPRLLHGCLKQGNKIIFTLESNYSACHAAANQHHIEYSFCCNQPPSKWQNNPLDDSCHSKGRQRQRKNDVRALRAYWRRENSVKVKNNSARKKSETQLVYTNTGIQPFIFNF